MPVMGPHNVTEEQSDKITEEVLKFLNEKFRITLDIGPYAFPNSEKEKEEKIAALKKSLTDLWQLDYYFGF